MVWYTTIHGDNWNVLNSRSPKDVWKEMLENILQLIYSFVLIVVNQERKNFLDVTMET